MQRVLKMQGLNSCWAPYQVRCVNLTLTGHWKNALIPNYCEELVWGCSHLDMLDQQWSELEKKTSLFSRSLTLGCGESRSILCSPTLLAPLVSNVWRYGKSAQCIHAHPIINLMWLALLVKDLIQAHHNSCVLFIPGAMTATEVWPSTLQFFWCETLRKSDPGKHFTKNKPYAYLRVDMVVNIVTSEIRWTTGCRSSVLIDGVLCVWR